MCLDILNHDVINYILKFLHIKNLRLINEIKYFDEIMKNSDSNKKLEFYKKSVYHDNIYNYVIWGKLWEIHHEQSIIISGYKYSSSYSRLIQKEGITKKMFEKNLEALKKSGFYCEYFKNIHNLNNLNILILRNLHITDISFLKYGLNNIGEIDLSRNYIADVSVFKDIMFKSKLQRLIFAHNNISDINGLIQGLKNSIIHTLDLSYNEAINISGLFENLNLCKIKILSLAGCNLSNSDYLKFGHLINLKYLNLSDNLLCDINNVLINGFGSLQVLHLQHNSFTDINLYASAIINSNLNKINFQSNYIVNIDKIINSINENNYNLKNIDFMNNNIATVPTLHKTDINIILIENPVVEYLETQQ